MERITCENCRFWSHPLWDLENAAIVTFDCRHAPTVCHADDDGLDSNRTWPRTSGREWCGDAEPVSLEMLEARCAEQKRREDSPAWAYLKPRQPRRR